MFPHSDNNADPEQHQRNPRRPSQADWLCIGPHHPELGAVETPSPEASAHHFCQYTPKGFLTVHRGERDDLDDAAQMTKSAVSEFSHKL